jgi:hypothetical protein
MPEQRITYFQSLAGASAIDPEAGVIRGVSLLTKGPALGHNIDIDDEGLAQALSALNARGKIRLIRRHDGEFEDIDGHAENFRIDGDRIRGDLHLLANSPARARILEIAEKMPSEFGLSIECDNGHIANPADPKRKLFRTGDVDAVALVPRPAANPRGLFAAVDTPAKSNSDNPDALDMDKNKLSKALTAALTKFAEGEAPTAATLADAISDAVIEAVTGEPVDTELSERVQKLEEAMPKEPSAEDKEKAEKDADTKLATKVGELVKMHLEGAETLTSLTTKLSKEFGIRRAPNGGGGYEHQDERTKLASEISAMKAAGAKTDAEAIFKLSREKPDVYNAARAAGLL